MDAAREALINEGARAYRQRWDIEFQRAMNDAGIPKPWWWAYDRELRALGAFVPYDEIRDLPRWLDREIGRITKRHAETHEKQADHYRPRGPRTFREWAIGVWRALLGQEAPRWA